MRRYYGLILLGMLSGMAPLAAADDMPKMRSHHAPHKAPISLLRDTGPMPDAAAALKRLYSGTKIDVLTYHYDNNRTGWNPTETDLTVASVNSKKFGLLTTLQVDGNVLAEPLLISNFVMPDQSTHDILIVATGGNSVYAFDALTYAVLWQRNLGTPQSTSDVGCNDVVPEYGISSTPVIMRSGANAATLYVVAATEPEPLKFMTELHVLNVATGADTVPASLILPSAKLSDGSALHFDPQNQWNRAGLAAFNGSVYVGIGSHCDNNSGNVSGWLLRFSAAGKIESGFHSIETPQDGNTELASIWMSGFAPAIDSAGNVFVATGNGAYVSGAKDWGESVLKLKPGLGAVADKFTDSNYFYLNSNDEDLGSGGVMLLPAISGQNTNLATAMGKGGTFYLLNQNNLGGLKPNNSGALQRMSMGGGLWGGPAFYNGPSGPTIFVQGDSSTLTALKLATSGQNSLTMGQTGTSSAGYGGSFPIISSHGASAGTGIVWVVRRSVPMALEAYDAVNLGNPIFQAYAGTWSNAQENPFVSAMQANGRVYVPAYKTVKVFGLAP